MSSIQIYIEMVKYLNDTIGYFDPVFAYVNPTKNMLAPYGQGSMLHKMAKLTRVNHLQTILPLESVIIQDPEP